MIPNIVTHTPPPRAPIAAPVKASVRAVAFTRLWKSAGVQGSGVFRERPFLS
jgi:hypothetical protein